MEYLTHGCGGIPVDPVDGLQHNVVGLTELVYKEVHGDEKYTIVEDVRSIFSCIVLLLCPNRHRIRHMRAVVRDVHRDVKNTISYL